MVHFPSKCGTTVKKYSLGITMSSALQYAGHVLYVDFKQMGFEVMEKAKPVHQIEVVVLDSAATYQSGKLIVKCCMKCLRGQF